MGLRGESCQQAVGVGRGVFGRDSDLYFARLSGRSLHQRCCRGISVGTLLCALFPNCRNETWSHLQANEFRQVGGIFRAGGLRHDRGRRVRPMGHLKLARPCGLGDVRQTRSNVEGRREGRRCGFGTWRRHCYVAPLGALRRERPLGTADSADSDRGGCDWTAGLAFPKKDSARAGGSGHGNSV